MKSTTAARPSNGPAATVPAIETTKVASSLKTSSKSSNSLASIDQAYVENSCPTVC